MVETTIIECPHCHAKNRFPVSQADRKAKCGRCHKPLDPHQSASTDTRVLTLRCAQCRTKNRVPAGKLDTGAKCGRCGAVLPHQDVDTGRTVTVTDANFAQTVLQSPLPVLLYGWAPWCSVCGGTNPQVDQLAHETKGKIRVGRLNVETNPQLASKYNILSVPAFIIFDAGQFKEHLTGGIPKHDLKIKMAAYI
jgi:thiol-disulfide isomerase/thioredoxin